VKLIAPNYLDKDLTLWYEIDFDVPVRIYGDLVRIRQIILNLLSNAFKFTKSGHVYLHVKLNIGSQPKVFEEDHEPSEYMPLIREDTNSDTETIPLLVYVADTGIGIPRDKLNKLFQSFSQVDASTTRNFGGTGLGLAISRRLCSMMGGDMVC
jgi:signal transduction histidine kinase